MLSRVRSAETVVLFADNPKRGQDFRKSLGKSDQQSDLDVSEPFWAHRVGMSVPQDLSGPIRVGLDTRMANYREYSLINAISRSAEYRLWNSL